MTKFSNINDLIGWPTMAGPFSNNKKAFGFGGSAHNGGVPTSSNATVQAWLNKIGNDGYTYPSQAKVDVYTAAWNYADANGITNKIDYLAFANTPTKDIIQIPFKHVNAAKRLMFSSPLPDAFEFHPNVGIVGDGFSYIDDSYTPSVDAVNFQTGNACIFCAGIYTELCQGSILGSVDYGTGYVNFINPEDNGAVIGGCLSTQALSDITTEGSFLVSTTHVGGNIYLYKAGLQISSDVDASQLVSDATIPFLSLCHNSDGGPESFFSAGFAKVWGAGSGAIDQAKLNTFVNMLLL